MKTTIHCVAGILLFVSSGNAQNGTPSTVCYEDVGTPTVCTFACSPPSSCCDIVPANNLDCRSVQVAECGGLGFNWYSVNCRASIYQPDGLGNSQYAFDVSYPIPDCKRANPENCGEC